MYACVQDVSVVFTMEEGEDTRENKEEHSVPQGQTIQFLKLLASKEWGVAMESITLKYKGEDLLDPFSLCDCIPPEDLGTGVDIAVTISQ